VVARHEIDYLQPIDYQPDPVRIDTWLVEVRNASFRVGYEMFDHDGGQIVARARTLMVPYDLTASRPRRLTAEEKAFLQKWLDPE
jgi:acyl-CoA thioester hydrolase